MAPLFPVFIRFRFFFSAINCSRWPEILSDFVRLLSGFLPKLCPRCKRSRQIVPGDFLPRQTFGASATLMDALSPVG